MRLTDPQITEAVLKSLQINNVPPTCMWCQKHCNTSEVVYTGDEDAQDGWEVWAYCQDCKTDTFHPIPKLT